MIIGLSGLAGSGKSTVANMLVKNHVFEAISLADPMKRFCKEMFGFSDEQLYGPSSARNAPDMRFVVPSSRQHGMSTQLYLTPRHALQQLGTEWGRACYEDVWVDYAMREAGRRKRMSLINGVCITDVRFHNEADAIHKAGGKVWRIARLGAGLEGLAAKHVSENDLTDYSADYDRVIDNRNGSLEDLAAHIAKIIGGKA